MWYLFEPKFSWFAVVCNAAIVYAGLYFDNMWLLLLNIPLSLIDSFMFSHYFLEEDENE